MASTRVCTTDELKPGGAVRATLPDGTPVAVFNVDGTLYAIGDTCSHEQSSLSEGFVEDATVECAKHGATFDLATGKNLSLPATQPVPAFSVRVEGDEIFVESQ